jgi:hypothetical protein
VVANSKVALPESEALTAVAVAVAGNRKATEVPQVEVLQAELLSKLGSPETPRRFAAGSTSMGNCRQLSNVLRQGKPLSSPMPCSVHRGPSCSEH